MKVLIQLYADKSKRILVELPAKVLVSEIKTLLKQGLYGKAVSTALMRGTMIREIDGHSSEELEACVILTESSAHYDLTGY